MNVIRWAFLATALSMAAFPSQAIQPVELSTPPFATLMERLDTIRGATIVQAACCKTCRKGKACGDSCISKTKTCRKGVGCACDG